MYLKSIQVLDSCTDLFHLSHGDVFKENLSLTKNHIIATVFQYRDRKKILLLSWNIHHIFYSKRGARLPLKGNYTDPGSTIPPIISKLYVLLEVFLLKITKEIFVPHNMERGSDVKISHVSHYSVGHACNESEIKFEL